VVIHWQSLGQNKALILFSLPPQGAWLWEYPFPSLVFSFLTWKDQSVISLSSKSQCLPRYQAQYHCINCTSRIWGIFYFLALYSKSSVILEHNIRRQGKIAKHCWFQFSEFFLICHLLTHTPIVFTLFRSSSSLIRILMRVRKAPLLSPHQCILWNIIASG
jgi:hypothetical protein